MARDLNKVQLTGRLGADPSLRTTTQGSALATFRVASNRTWRNAAGISHEETEWFRVVAWDQLAERCGRELGQGCHIYVEGRLQTRQWIETDGQQRVLTEVVASEVIVLTAASPRGAVREPRPARRSALVRPAAPPPDLATPPLPKVQLREEDLPI
ncbi:MAG: single-stranded DNA-binding protein [Oscillochloridaceae bacterium umkhey_bin13]